jgi:hypothetical protein
VIYQEKIVEVPVEKIRTVEVIKHVEVPVEKIIYKDQVCCMYERALLVCMHVLNLHARTNEYIIHARTHARR